MPAKSSQIIEETVMTLPVGALDTLIRAVEGMPQEGRGQGIHLEASPVGRNEPMMCHKTHGEEEYVVVKIIRPQLSKES